MRLASETVSGSLELPCKDETLHKKIERLPRDLVPFKVRLSLKTYNLTKEASTAILRH